VQVACGCAFFIPPAVRRSWMLFVCGAIFDVVLAISMPLIAVFSTKLAKSADLRTETNLGSEGQMRTELDTVRQVLIV